METSGLLLADKPLNMTSHDVVNILRKRLSIKKIGHAGTLDPQATGLLLMLVGKKATKASNIFRDLDKTYAARLTLGIKTDSADHTGAIVAEKNIPLLSDEIIFEAFERFTGTILQTPPMVSAKKIKGKKLYKLARKGIEVVRDPVEIRIKRIRITKIDLPDIEFVVTCSKGTYVRTLCEDIGGELGTYAHMNGLRRVSVGSFDVKDALDVEKIKIMTPEDICKRLLDIGPIV